MITAYVPERVYKFAVLQQSKRWYTHGFMDAEQYSAIKESYTVPFYHPGLAIRLTLFFATLLALSGITGMLGVIVSELGVTAISVGVVLYGFADLVVLERNFITASNHYKSGVTEGLLYHACGFIIGGIGNLLDFNVHVVLVVCLIVFTLATIRYLDWICTLASGIAFAGLVFYEFYQLGGIFQQIIPFVFIVVFTLLYFLIRNLKKGDGLKLWRDNLVIIETLSLLSVYAGGNYLVVRELSISLLNMQLEERQDIPFAGIFYGLTILLPVIYLLMGIRTKNVVLIRVGMFVAAFSVYTFHHYYSLGPPEITLTIAGAVLFAMAILLHRYLKVMRGGFTGENILTEKWAGTNVQAFLISQTMGGNQPTADTKFKGGGGDFGGGGASGDF
jgi:hypothetical protein